MRRCNRARVASLLVLHIVPFLVEERLATGANVLTIVLVVIFVVFFITSVFFLGALRDPRKTRQVVLLEDLDAVVLGLVQQKRQQLLLLLMMLIMMLIRMILLNLVVWVVKIGILAVVKGHLLVVGRKVARRVLLIIFLLVHALLANSVSVSIFILNGPAADAATDRVIRILTQGDIPSKLLYNVILTIITVHRH